MMYIMKTGIVSITFRKLSPERIVALCQEAGAEAIEWGGDIHVPHGDIAAANKVSELTVSSGLEVAAYGSYYRSVNSENEGLKFESVLATAEALGSKRIRVWAGACQSKGADADYRKAVADNLREISAKAEQSGIRICLEYHTGTLTDTSDSAVALMEAIDHPNCYSLWQPTFSFTKEEKIASLHAILPWLDYLHIYAWTFDREEIARHPLHTGTADWREYLDIAKAKQPPFGLLEFVSGERPEQFVEDIATLKSWLA